MLGTGCRRVALPAALAFAAAGTAETLDAQALSPREIAANAQAAVLVIKALDADGDTAGVGTGFVVREDGAFVTNFHVVQHAASLHVETLDGRVFRDVSVLAFDAPSDLAVLRVEGRGMRALPLGSDADAQVGDRVFVMGNPLGMTGTFTDGMVSARRPVNGVSMLQVSAAIAPGSSGGPVMNERGEVIGVATMFADGAAGLSLAVPARYVRPLLQARRPPIAFRAGLLGPPPRRGLALIGVEPAPRVRAPKTAPHPGEEIARHFEALRPLLGLQGLELAFRPRPGFTAGAEERSHEFRLRGGVRYLIAGYCGADCQGLGLAVAGGAARPAGTGADDAAVAFVPPRDGTYRVVVRMAGCAADPCAYGLAVFAPTSP